MSVCHLPHWWPYLYPQMDRQALALASTGTLLHMHLPPPFLGLFGNPEAAGAMRVGIASCPFLDGLRLLDLGGWLLLAPFLARGLCFWAFSRVHTFGQTSFQF